MPIGEIWYERTGTSTAHSLLLLKLLFTSEPLSVQVHPDDAYARTMGLPNGKTEAWYILSSSPEAKGALGLKQRLDPQQLRQAITDGSISDLVMWMHVSSDDATFVPAGTIHAIGPGLVIAEIQQRSDATFRMFDYGRQRKLHIKNAIAVADVGAARLQVRPIPLTEQPNLLVSCDHFVLERIDLAPESSCCLEAKRETWLLFLRGSTVAGSFDVATGDAIFAESDRLTIDAGGAGSTFLAAYLGPDTIADFLCPRLDNCV